MQPSSPCAHSAAHPFCARARWSCERAAYVTTEEGPAALASLAVERFGQLDVAVANAGGGVACSIVDHTLDDWRRVLDLTLTGSFLTIRAAGRVMVDSGSIVAIA